MGSFGGKGVPRGLLWGAGMPSRAGGEREMARERRKEEWPGREAARHRCQAGGDERPRTR